MIYLQNSCYTRGMGEIRECDYSSSIESRLLLRLLPLLFQHRSNSSLLQFLQQLSRAMHVEKDVTASNKLSIHIDLWESGPVGEDFGALTNTFIGEDIERGGYGSTGFRIRLIQHAMRFKNSTNGVGKSTLRSMRFAFHEDNNSRLGGEFGETIVECLVELRSIREGSWKGTE